MDNIEENGSNDIQSISEKELIQRITKSFKNKNSSTKVDIGDDAAILRFEKYNLAISQDILVENVHFDLSYVPLKHLGYKSVVVNISDIISMNVKPSHVLVSIAVSNRFKIDAIEEIKTCLDMFTSSLKEIQIREDILEDPKYQYIFSVDTLNDLVKQGMPFRDAYKKMGEDIEKGNYKPKKALNHTHLGSIGNLALDSIQTKMEQALSS